MPSDCPETVSVTLRRAIHDLHDRIEHLPIMAPLTAGRVTPQEYGFVLARLYGFYAPLEDVLFERGNATAISMGVQPKSASLANDLLALGLSDAVIAALPKCSQLPALSNAAEQLGALYVLEGATLGGRVVLRRITGSLGDLADTATTFHGFHGDGVGPWWKHFQAQMEQRLNDEQSRDHAVQGAVATFEALGDWLGKSP